MTTFIPTPEQVAILDRAVSGSAPVIIIEAGPGCAKTTTLIEIMALLAPNYNGQWKMNQCKLAYTAFNKDIVTETASKLIAKGINTTGIFKVDCATFNSLGLRVWFRTVELPGGKMEPSFNKNKQILRGIQDQGRYSISPDEWDDMESLMRLAKSQGYLPPKSGSAYGTLIDFKTLCEIGDITPKQHYEFLLNTALLASIRAAYKAVIDFDDMLYMSAFFGTIHHIKLDWLFVDEAQDLTPVQLFFVKRIKPQFLVLVGDPMQAIYAFRGAMTDSFDKIKAMWPDAIRLPLMTSFRIPKAVLPLLRERNPDLMTASKVVGEVEAPDKLWTMRELAGLASSRETMAILCRNNAPLYRVALACMSVNVPFAMNDQNWGNGLIRDIKRVFENPSSWPLNTDVGVAVFHHKLLEYWSNRLSEDDKKGESIMYDKLNSLDALIEITGPSNIAGLLLTINALLKKANPSDKAKPLMLSTAHKAKGLEFDIVVHLDSDLIPAHYATTDEELAQEANIAYVINSRTKSSLLFISSHSILIHGVPAIKPRPNKGVKQ